ncbi:MAG TPA: DUF1684 domain-containing protein [Thermoanaerobaculia bacterium]|nr:DUF1684 domain-containing protein [Thermoanaerobaculia bacterium]
MKVSDDAHRAEIEKWRSRRIERLKADDGWLTVVGLFWLEPGENGVGSGKGNRVILPAGKAPAKLGTIRLSGNEARLEVARGVDVTHDGKRVESLVLASDEQGDPTLVRHATLSFHLIKRGDRLGVRVRDSASDARQGFHGIAAYPVRSAWRVTGRLDPYPPGKTIPVPNVLGTVSNDRSPGAVVFEVGGKTYRIDAVEEEGSDELFLIFGDRTNGFETYGAGRFLYVARPGPDGKMVIDFNKAYNPPCAFTAYATCPLPPPQNRLALRVEVGEKEYGDH